MPFTGYVVNSTGQQEWPCGIGNFIISFGAIEAQTYLWLRELGRDMSRLQQAMEQPFSARVNLVFSLLEDLSADEALKEQAREAWESARTLAQFRNTIAHSPLALVGQGTGGVADYIGIIDFRSATGDRLQFLERFGLDTIRAATDEAVALAQRLGNLLEQLSRG